MSFIIQASKLSRIFCIRDWQQKCLVNPGLLYAESKPGEFSVTVPRSAGAVTLRHRIPVHAATLLPRLTTIQHKDRPAELVQTRVQGDDELRNLVPWLTGGPDGSQFLETDRWGIVELPIAGNYINLQAEYMSQEAMIAAYPEQAEAIEQERKKLQLQMRSAMQSAMSNAVALADERVIRAIKSVYNNFYQQNKTNLENGIGRVTPTDAEKLVAFYLHEQIQKKTADQKDMMDKVRGVLQHNIVGG